MLTQETKRKIDSARQILVGKVPDPKAQVEQITTALIYKFMDDMDKEAQELGGKARFFTNDYQKYAWTKIMDSRIGGQDRLNLYVEAITTLSQNPHLPQLFRDIFKDAFLPYRDPETLNLFLKEINGFIYEHSEDLGDVFEYLLSILGSQGDAGQFRTPRHIIDFIVAAVDPKKDETICDPACGTAGFLISAFKHILKENKEKSLTPDERKNLMDHFVGYDISPDMVRLSKVNLYLHSFPNPTIFEYDTLSSEEKWGENFDVMLANPPFMSPSGGIRPHKRFSVQANRSEVLFIDYILEHLRPNGRAGIIVPEGIIFQSATAYKALRKLLIEDGLLAVVSLPAGVFNPYAGVKTSILLFDNGLAKKTKDILFLKISNDGFDLGAQRREIDKNDLPLALEIVKEYKTALKENKKFKLNKKQSKIAHLVAKEKIAESGDYNLSGDRYIETVNFANQKWPLITLGEVCDIFNGSTPARNNQKYWINGNIPWFTVDDIRGQGRVISHTQQKITQEALKETSVKLLPRKTVLLCCTASVGEYAITEIDLTTNQQFNGLVVKKEYKDKLLPEFLFYLASTFKKELIRVSGKTSFNYVSVGTLKKIKIPLPPLEVQKEIVEQIEVKQKAIDAAKAVIENLERDRRYFGQEIKKIKDVEWVELGEVITLEYGKPMKEEDRKGGEYPVFGSNGVVGYHNEYLAKGPFIVVGRKGTAGAVTYSEKNGFPIDTTFYVKLKNKNIVDLKYLYYTMTNLKLGKVNIQSGVPGLNRNDAYKVKIPLPPLEIQKQLVAEVEEQEKIIEANKKLIGIMEQKITEVLREI